MSASKQGAAVEAEHDENVPNGSSWSQHAHQKSKEFWWLPHAVLVLTSCIAGIWSLLVLQEVPEPYLDELFHIPQAQAYCNRKFDQWDPKLTTPPGLYLLPLPFYWVGLGDCSVKGLRSENLVLLGALGYTAFRFLARRTWEHSSRGIVSLGDLLYDAHIALNVCLFPPLFFFSALYYTDIASTLMVLLFLNDFLARPTEGIRFSFRQLFYATLALLMRQTNIFWVAILPAAIDVVTVLKTEKVWKTPEDKARSIYDRKVEDSVFEDYLQLPVTILYEAVQNLALVVMAVPQHVLLLTLFGAFVAWNGGVVLGDKSNHVATVHISQMLYVWPYTTFFSFPILLPWILDILQIISARDLSAARLPGYGLILILTGIAALVVRFNTIVHPFTLADNRHYMFYIFRQLLRNSATKYGATPVYVLSGWLCIRRLGARPLAGVPPASSDKTKATSQGPSESNTVPLTFIWLITTALSLVTAPLVEPRYFIIPWVVWRLLVPPGSRAPSDAKPSVNKITGKPNGPTATALKQHDGWLWLETLWFMTVNVVTGYLFLYKGFEWAQEPGKVQRFMW